MINVYGPRERYLAKQLDRFPRLKRVAKRAYQRLCYWLHRPAENVASACPIHPVGRAKDDVFVGYYDKTPWSPDMERLLVHRASHGEELEIACFRVEHEAWQPVGTTTAWNWQQGAMAQWLSSDSVIFNCVQKGSLGACVYGIGGPKETFIRWPVQTVHPKGRRWISLNYRRLQRIRPEYGYDVEVENFSPDQPDEADGLWLADLKRARAELVMSLSALKAHRPRESMLRARHKVNHALYSPTGDRLAFLHRWVGRRGKFSRLYVMNEDGTGLRVLLDERIVSHYSWHDEDQLLVWGRSEEHGAGYHLVDGSTGRCTRFGTDELWSYGDGHPSYSPDGRWVVTDTYPDRSRRQHLLLFDTRTEELYRVATFLAPLAFRGEERCDLHPRWSPDGKHVSVDSAHTGKRRSYMVDVSELVSKPE